MKSIKIFLIISLMTFCSCGFILKKMYGIKSIKNYDSEDQEEYLSDVGFKSIENYEFDSLSYDKFFTREYSLDTHRYYDSTSIVLPQVRVFDQSGNQLIAWQQCWGKSLLDSILSSYPPTENQRFKIWTNPKALSLQELSKSFIPYNTFKPTNQYSMVIYWSASMGKLNKRMLEKLHDYKERNPHVRLIMVNMDGLVNSNDF